jgi:hypothetical protein
MRLYPYSPFHAHAIQELSVEASAAYTSYYIGSFCSFPEIRGMLHVQHIRLHGCLHGSARSDLFSTESLLQKEEHFWSAIRPTLGHQPFGAAPVGLAFATVPQIRTVLEMPGMYQLPRHIAI